MLLIIFFVIASLVIVLLYEMKCVILVKWSRTTKIESKILESKRFTIKSINIDYHSLVDDICSDVIFDKFSHLLSQKIF